MEKRFQVFVSSTAVDLRQERLRVLETLLDLNLIPAGMEFFPASARKTMDVIRRIIASSDYFVLLLGGRYGSVDAAGVSFTEKEFETARELEVPVLAFVHEHPGEFQVQVVDATEEARQQFDRFRSRILSDGSICKLWRYSGDLVPKVAAALHQAMLETPRPGWTRQLEQRASSDDDMASFRGRFGSLAPAVVRPRVMVFWHEEGLEKRQALAIVSELSDMFADVTIGQHTNPVSPDAIFVSPLAPSRLVAAIIRRESSRLRFIFPVDYPDAECGALSDFVVSVGLCSSTRDTFRPTDEEPYELTARDINRLLEAATDDGELKSVLYDLAPPRRLKP